MCTTGNLYFQKQFKNKIICDFHLNLKAKNFTNEHKKVILKNYSREFSIKYFLIRMNEIVLNYFS